MKLFRLIILFILAVLVPKIQNLSHIVIPFAPSQVPVLLRNIKIWSKYTPSTTNALNGIVFLSAEFLNISQETIIRRALDSNLKLKKCFKNIEFKYSNITNKKSHLHGSMKMFEQIIFNDLNIQNLECFF